jgi:hypothetical protein
MHSEEGNMAGSIRQLIIGAAIAVAMAAVGVSVIGSAVALPPAIERAQSSAPEPSRGQTTLSGTVGRLSDQQEIRRMFIDGARERLR